MMNKRSSRLMAWLLTLMMFFNILPAPAFAGVTSSSYTGPEYAVVNIGDYVDNGNAPSSSIDWFDVKYIVSGEYTSTGEYYYLSQYDKRVTNNAPSSYQEKPQGFQVVGRKWDDTKKELVLLLSPNKNGRVTLHYVIIYNNKSGGYSMTTMNDMRPAWTDDIVSDRDVAMLFNQVIPADHKDITHYDENTANPQKELNEFEPLRIHKDFIHFSKTISYEGHEYGLKYFGNDYLISGNKELSANINDINKSDVIDWTYSSGVQKITLYYILTADGVDKTIGNVTPAPTAVTTVTPTPVPTATATAAPTATVSVNPSTDPQPTPGDG